MRIAIIFAAVLILVAAALANNEVAERSVTDSGNTITTVSRVMTYQGMLKDNAGNPVPDATYNLSFRLYDAASGGSALWISATIPVTTLGGSFSAEFGPVSLPFNNTYYISLQVGSNPEMAPRQKLTAVAYALRADSADFAVSADMLDGLHAPAFSLVSHQHDAAYVNEGQANSITSAMITDGTVNSNDIQDNSVGTADIAVGGVTSSNLGNNSVITAKIADGTILFSDIGQNGAGSGQVVKWNGTAWVAANDSIGAGSAPSGWTDNNHYVTLASSSDSVGIGLSSPVEKLHVQGNLKIWGKANIGPINTNSGSFTSVLGGNENTADGDYGFIGGGRNQNLYATYGGICSGNGNTAGYDSTKIYSFVGGGFINRADDNYSTIGGGYVNSALGDYAGVFSGSNNIAENSGAFVGGGVNNTANGEYATVSGGLNNYAASSGTVAGGDSNRADWKCMVGGGSGNFASGAGSTVAGGQNNTANAQWAAVCGGYNNTVMASGSTISGGTSNRISASDCAIPSGTADTITSSGGGSMVFGNNVYCNSSRYVVLYDGLNYGRLSINRDGRDGLWTYPITVGTNTANGNGAYLTNGGVWTNGSSRTFKENFTPYDGNELLSKISNLSITSYNYKGTSEKHIGPVAEEFVGAFDTGVIRESDGKRDDMYLSSGDVAGVALAGVQEIIKQNKELKSENENMKIKIDNLERRLSELERNR